MAGSEVLTLFLVLVFFMCGLLLGALKPPRKSHQLLIVFAFIILIMFMGDIRLQLLIIFFVGLTVSSMMWERMQMMRKRRGRQETIKI